MTPVNYARLAALLFAAETAFAVVHRLTGGVYPGYTNGYTVFNDVSLAVVWGAATLACLIHRGWPGFVMLLVGSSASLMFGMLFSLASGKLVPIGVGIPFLVAGGGQLYMAVHAARAFREPVSEEKAPRRHLLAGLLRPRHSH